MPFRCNQSSPLASCRKSFRSAPMGSLPARRRLLSRALLMLTACVPLGYPSSRKRGVPRLTHHHCKSGHAGVTDGAGRSPRERAGCPRAFGGVACFKLRRAKGTGPYYLQSGPSRVMSENLPLAAFRLRKPATPIDQALEGSTSLQAAAIEAFAFWASLNMRRRLPVFHPGSVATIKLQCPPLRDV
jgi:hypothetical protein